MDELIQAEGTGGGGGKGRRVTGEQHSDLERTGMKTITQKPAPNAITPDGNPVLADVAIGEEKQKADVGCFVHCNGGCREHTVETDLMMPEVVSDGVECEVVIFVLQCSAESAE